MKNMVYRREADQVRRSNQSDGWSQLQLYYRLKDMDLWFIHNHRAERAGIDPDRSQEK